MKCDFCVCACQYICGVFVIEYVCVYKVEWDMLGGQYFMIVHKMQVNESKIYKRFVYIETTIIILV